MPDLFGNRKFEQTEQVFDLIKIRVPCYLCIHSRPQCSAAEPVEARERCGLLIQKNCLLYTDNKEHG